MKKYNYILLLLIIPSVFFSCYRTLDFDQAELTARPVLDVDLAYFDLRAPQLLDPVTAAELTIVRDSSRIEIFDNVDTQNALTRIDFVFKIKNEFVRDFNANIRFVDENFNPTKTININVNHATIVNGTISPTYITQQETISTPAELDAFKLTKHVIIEAELLPDATGISPILAGDTAIFNFQSAGTFYFDLGL